MAYFRSAPIFSREHAEFEEALASITKRICEQEDRRKKIAETLDRLKRISLNGFEGILESDLVKQVSLDALSDLIVVGVDGGLLKQELGGLDLILVRAIAVTFHYHGGKLDRAEYFPSEMPHPQLISVSEPLDAREFELLAGMERQLAEIKLAAEVLKKTFAELLLLDGSVVPQYTDRPSRNPELLERYIKLLGAYRRLYNICAESGTLLAGVVKNSRSGRFTNTIVRKILSNLDDPKLGKKELEILERSRDIVFLNNVLNVGERTLVFRYADIHALRDLGEWAARVYAFYLKPVPFDHPLRIEFVSFSDSQSETADSIASLVYALSSYHDGFGLPSVLVEADARVRIAEEDMSIIRDTIIDRLDPSMLFDLRKYQAPL